jgi:hypothetical protein
MSRREPNMEPGIYRRGERVRITVEGVVRQNFTDESDSASIGADTIDGVEYTHIVFETSAKGHVEVIEPTLPEAPGVYVSQKWGGNLVNLFFILEKDGNWMVHWGDGEVEARRPLPGDLPLVRLVRP